MPSRYVLPLPLEFRHLVLERAWASSRPISCADESQICTGLEKGSSGDSGLSPSVRAPVDYVTGYNTVIHKISYRFEMFHELVLFLSSTFSAHLLNFQKLRVLSLVPCNFEFIQYTCFLHPLCLGFHFRKIASKTTVKLEHSPRYKLMLSKPHSLPLHLNLPQKKTKSQMLTK